MSEIIHGDALTVLRTLPDASVQCCISSPPYYALRDYGVDGQIGMEATPQEYIATLVDVFCEVRRVLRGDGTLWLNLGDSYSSDGKWGGHTGGKHVQDLHGADGRRERRESGLPVKNLLMIPARVAIALQEDGWILRSDIIWHKPTAMPESVEDRPTSAHEHLFLLAKSERYYYDADAIREPLRPKTYTTFGTKHHAQGNDALGLVKSDNWGRTVAERQPRLSADGSIAGANKRNVWTIAAQPYNAAHFATMPPKLVEPCILAGTPPKTCEQCGAPWTRVTECTPMIIRNGPKSGGYGSRTTDGLSGTMVAPAERRTTGWQPTCECAGNTGAGRSVVLDCFMGAGTVALVALQHNRDYLGIELNADYIELAKKRIQTVQPWLWDGSEEAV